MNIKDALDIFGADENTAFALVQSRYRKLAKEYHPDIVSSMYIGHEEKSERTEYWKRVSEAYNLIKKRAPDANDLIWYSSAGMKKIEDLFAMRFDEEGIKQEVAHQKLLKELESYFGDAGYPKKIPILYESHCIPLSHPCVNLEKDIRISCYESSVTFNGVFLTFNPSGMENYKSIYGLVDAVRARDRLFNKKYIPIYLNPFLEEFGLDLKINSKTIQEMCEDIEKIETDSLSEREFQIENSDRGMNISSKSMALLSKYKVDEIAENYGEVLESFIRSSIGYNFRAEQKDSEYRIETIGSWDVLGEEQEKAHFTLSEDDYKLIELMFLGKSLFEEGLLTLLKP
ncbi:MAG: DnaJ domain-containing protein [Candidatus Nanoarchaeia archaeon]|nr:DnaJ domain-containing protein [Candidatus Nanoarchaeia archaeon]MDD5239319.1 DnaJ domain-containing protein [Candidatus Nanoarchaeia archaeon]